MIYGAIRKGILQENGKGCFSSTLKPVFAEWKVAGPNEDEAKRTDPDALLAAVADKTHGMLVALGPCDASRIRFHRDQEFRKQAEAMKVSAA